MSVSRTLRSAMKPVSMKPIEEKKSKKVSLAVVRKKSTAANVESVALNEIIICKMRGFCAWPARVIKIDGTRITVQFFGDNTTHTTTIKNIFCFANSMELLLGNLSGRRNPLYAKSIREAETVLGIPAAESITN